MVVRLKEHVVDGIRYFDVPLCIVCDEPSIALYQCMVFGVGTEAASWMKIPPRMRCHSHRPCEAHGLPATLTELGERLVGLRNWEE